MRNEQVLGVDACKTGWVGIALGGDGASAYFAKTIEELVERAAADNPVAVVAVDMPIGLPDRGLRQADLLAQNAVGKLRSSVFTTPVRAALEAPDHRTATARNRTLAGVGISIQAFSLKPRLMQVQQWVHRTRHRVVEAHPEVSFVQLAGAPLNVRKKSWAGATRRCRLLADAGVNLAADLGAAGSQATVDDVLDAAACAWTARRVARGEARSRPDRPEVFSDGLQCAIWS
jgi:predicted RNase H-like nuclease